MNATTTPITQDRPVLDERVAGAGAVIVAIASLVFANFVGVAEGDNGGVGEFVTTGTLTLALAAIVYGWAVPRAREASRVRRGAVILAALSVLGVPMFWSGLSQIAAPAAILLGYEALHRHDGRRAGTVAAMAIAGLAYLAAVTACIVG